MVQPYSMSRVALIMLQTLLGFTTFVSFLQRHWSLQHC
jgi:hypothetical protein